MVRQADIIAYARTRGEFSRKDIICSLKEKNIDFSTATVTSALVALTKDGIIRKVKRGLYEMADSGKQPFTPYYDDEMNELELRIRQQFHFVRFCVWNSSDVRRFAHYVLNMDVIYVDAERDSMESMFTMLINAKLSRQVYLRPSSNEYSYHIFGKPSIVVRPLVSEAPLIAYSGKSHRVSLEKLMVDIATDDDFISLRDYESLRFYRNAMDTCIINETKLLRYASRRGCKEKIKSILDATKQTDIID